MDDLMLVQNETSNFFMIIEKSLHRSTYWNDTVEETFEEYDDNYLRKYIGGTSNCVILATADTIEELRLKCSPFLI
jgi:hypothetical protein